MERIEGQDLQTIVEAKGFKEKYENFSKEERREFTTFMFKVFKLLIDAFEIL